MKKFPQPPDELVLHERVVAHEPTATVDLFDALVEPLVQVVREQVGCTEDSAYDSAIDAIVDYIEDPGRFDPEHGRLSTFLADIAKKRGIDRARAASSRAAREGKWAVAVELRRAATKQDVEAQIDADKMWNEVVKLVPDERDQQVVQLMAAGERSTAVYADALGLPPSFTDAERRAAVKRHKDRLDKVLSRLGKRFADDDA